MNLIVIITRNTLKLFKLFKELCIMVFKQKKTPEKTVICNCIFPLYTFQKYCSTIYGIVSAIRVAIIDINIK